MLHVTIIVFNAFVTFNSLLVLLTTEKLAPAVRWMVGIMMILSAMILALTIASPDWFR